MLGLGSVRVGACSIASAIQWDQIFDDITNDLMKDKGECPLNEFTSHKASEDIMGTGHIVVRVNATFVGSRKKHRLKIHELMGGQSRVSRLRKETIYI